MADKKVLIISPWAPPAPGGGPVALANLFKHIPSTRYAILTRHISFDGHHMLKPLLCQYYFYDQKRDGSIKPLNNHFINSYLTIRDLFSLISIGTRLVRQQRFTSILAVTDFRISLIGSYFVSLLTKTPLDILVFDLYKGNRLSWMQQILATIFEPIIFGRARTVFTAGAGNKEHYSRLYKKPYVVVNNSVDTEQLGEPQAEVHKGPWRIVFTGSVYWAQRDTIEFLASVIQDMPQVTISIYSNQSWDVLGPILPQFRDKITLDFVEHQHIADAYHSADILLLPLSFGQDGIDIIKTASPGKFGDYLISGVPILIVAPPYAFISRYAKKHECALVVDKLDAEMLRQAIERLAHDSSLRKQLVHNAQALAKSDFDSKQNSLILQKALFQNRHVSQ